MIRPLLTGPNVEFIGEISASQKASFLGDASALLFPIDWPEPFGIVMIEAMACGTPVIAMRRGSVPEIIRDGVSGYVANSEMEFLAAIDQVGDCSRAGCGKSSRRALPAVGWPRTTFVYTKGF